MCSYNAINGHPSCANNYILNDIVRNKWGQINSHISTDCGAVPNLRGNPVNAQNDTLAAAYAINNGTDLEMGSSLFNNLNEAVKLGIVSEGELFFYQLP